MSDAAQQRPLAPSGIMMVRPGTCMVAMSSSLDSGMVMLLKSPGHAS